MVQIDAQQAMSIGISMIYTILQAVVAVFLFKRARDTKVRELRYMFLAFLSATLAAVLGIPWTGFRILLNPLVAIFILPFVKATFQQQKGSTCKKLLAISTCLFGYSSAARLVWQFSMQEHGPEPFYLSYLVAITTIFVLCFGWFFVECLRAYRKIVNSKGIEPWIKYRYVLLGVSCVFAVLTAVLPLFYPSQETFHEEASIMKMVMAISNVLFSITSLLAWFMPAWIKRGLSNIQYARMHAPEQATSGASIPVPGMNGAGIILSIIEHIGDKIAPRINKSPGAVKGLLLLSLESVNEGSIATMSFSQLHEALKNEVRGRLESLGILDVAGIIDDMLREAAAMQSLLVITKV
jgi:hypothetical protein